MQLGFIQLSERTNRIFAALGIAGFLLVFLLVLFRTGWQSDDAYITYRTIDNYLHGYGLTYNPGWRVQAYTHPLWMLLHIPLFKFTGEVFFTGIFVGMGVTMAALGVGIKSLGTHRTGIAFLLLAALFSKAFIDFSTSGLENPLTHLLLAFFFWKAAKGIQDFRQACWLVFIAGLAVLNRMDIGLMYFPSLLYIAYRFRGIRHWLRLALAFAPLIVWELFSTFYYGFPFPNTAYAKLGTGIGMDWKIPHGLHYLAESFSRNPITLLIILAAILTVAMRKWYMKERTSAFLTDQLLMLGVILYVFYIVWIGGDFMSGRFLTAPFWVSAWVTARACEALRPRLREAMLLVVLALGLILPGSPVFSGRNYGLTQTVIIDAYGVADERAYYYPTCGLIHNRPGTISPRHPWSQQGLVFQGRKQKVVVHPNQGFVGYHAGPEVHIVDPLALTDPFLARQPVNTAIELRPGHVNRIIPPGYKESLITGQNQLQDSAQAVLYDKLHHITADPLWDWQRLKEIVKINLGHYN